MWCQKVWKDDKKILKNIKSLKWHKIGDCGNKDGTRKKKKKGEGLRVSVVGSSNEAYTRQMNRLGLQAHFGLRPKLQLIRNYVFTIIFLKLNYNTYIIIYNY